MTSPVVRVGAPPATATPSTTPPAPATPRTGAGGVHLNRNELLAGGGVLGALVLVVLVMRRRKAAAPAAGDSGGLSTSTFAGSPVAGLTGSPDTTATDIQNWLQNQANLLGNQAAGGTTDTTPPAPTTHGFQSGNTNVIRNDATGGIYQVQDGGMWHLSGPELAMLGFKDDSSWGHFSDPNMTGPDRWLPNVTG